MVLLNAMAKSLQVADLEWSRLLDAGRDSGWTPKGCRTALNLPGADYISDQNDYSAGQQITSEDARNLAGALRRSPGSLAAQLEINEEKLQEILSFLENGGFVLTSDLFALSQNLK